MVETKTITMRRIILLVPLALVLCFSSILQAQSLTRAEYFYDTDPGVGHGTQIAITTPSDSVNQNLSLPTSSLTSGWHYLFVRFRDSLGIWGLYTGQSFYISGSNIDTAANSSPKISAAEYFFDTDPGVGNGTAFAPFTAADSVNLAQDMPTTSLSTGFHYLYARFKYSNGVWGNPNLSQSFYVSQGNIDTAANSSPKINRAEYFFDTDPGEGSGTAYTSFTAADSVSLIQNIATGSLGQGFHYLYTRFGYSNGVWGLPTAASFFVLNPATQDTSPPINYVEYFFDTDPGVGNATGSAVTPSTDSANLALNVSTSGLISGRHILFVRFRYINGVWGLYQAQGDTFTVCPPPVSTISAGGTTAFCTGGSVTLTSDTNHLYSYQWQRNGVNLPGDTTPTLHITDSSGIYNIVIDSANCPGNSNSITVSVNAPTSYTYIQTICQGQQYNFNGRNLSATGTYYDTVQNAHTCDSIITLHLTVTSAILESITGSICPGGSYRFNGRTLTQGGVYRDTAIAAGGCDSITTLTLTQYNTATTPVSGFICQGSTYPFAGHNLDTAGVYTDTLSTVHGCDSIIVLTLAEYYAVYDTVSAHICQGGSYSFNGNSLTSAGTYQGTFNTVHGCDSNVTLHLTVLLPVADSTTAAICAGSSYPFNGRNITTAGVYTDTLTGNNTCDSIVTLTLTVNPLPGVSWAGAPDTVCNNAGPQTLGGATPSGGTYSGTGVYAGVFYPDSAGAGSYVITYTYRDSNQCTDNAAKTYVVQNCTGINNVIANTITLFPNPATDVVVIQSATTIGSNTQLLVRDVTGKEVTLSYQLTANTIVLNINHLASGMYLVTVTINGQESTARFVKETN